MNPEELDTLLSSVELRLHVVAETVLQGDGPALQAAAVALRDAAMHFAQATPQGGATAVRPDARQQLRLKRVRQSFVSCRENLVRRAAGVDRMLAFLLPPSAPQGATYGGAPGMAATRGRFGAASRYS